MRVLAAIAMASLCALAAPAGADIPTGSMTADGGPPAPTRKTTPPRTEQRAAERTTPAPEQG